MTIPKRLIKFLDDSEVKYDVINHRTVYTAHDKTKTLKEKPSIVAKTLVLKLGRKDIGIVSLPANKNVDKRKIKKLINQQREKVEKKKIKKVKFASERLMKNRLKSRGVRMGAIVPFGNFLKVPTFINKSLLNKKRLILNSGRHEQSIIIKGKDFSKIVPNVIKGRFTKSR
jgi:prolyl-tRNA editing enzyme YbaK/EbsC (Cys-tRNA(Pro) deacylase)